MFCILASNDISLYLYELSFSLIYTLSPCQSTTGGFSGGHGQLSHLAPSYAAVLSLLITCEERAYRLIDRKTM